jgi:hypothetical protein
LVGGEKGIANPFAPEEGLSQKGLMAIDKDFLLLTTLHRGYCAQFAELGT